MCSRALKFGPDVTLEELILRQALGLALDNYRVCEDPHGVMMIPIPCSGRLAGVAGVEQALALNGVQQVLITIATGESVVALPDGDRYLGFIFARGDTPEVVERTLLRAHARLQFDITRH